MKRSVTPDISMFAPCGVNCLLCYRYLRQKNPCKSSCSADLASGAQKNCKRFGCVRESGHQDCFECADFPCKLIKSLDKSYIQRYGVSLIENSYFAKARGISAFLENDVEKWRCECGGLVSVHTRLCSECGKTKLADASE